MEEHTDNGTGRYQLHPVCIRVTFCKDLFSSICITYCCFFLSSVSIAYRSIPNFLGHENYSNEKLRKRSKDTANATLMSETLSTQEPFQY